MLEFLGTSYDTYKYPLLCFYSIIDQQYPLKYQKGVSKKRWEDRVQNANTKIVCPCLLYEARYTQKAFLPASSSPSSPPTISEISSQENGEFFLCFGFVRPRKLVQVLPCSDFGAPGRKRPQTTTCVALFSSASRSCIRLENGTAHVADCPKRAAGRHMLACVSQAYTFESGHVCRRSRVVATDKASLPRYKIYKRPFSSASSHSSYTHLLVVPKAQNLAYYSPWEADGQTATMNVPCLTCFNF